MVFHVCEATSVARGSIAFAGLFTANQRVANRIGIANQIDVFIISSIHGLGMFSKPG